MKRIEISKVALCTNFFTGLPYVGPSTVFRHILVVELYILNLNCGVENKQS